MPFLYLLILHAFPASELLEEKVGVVIGGGGYGSGEGKFDKGETEYDVDSVEEGEGVLPVITKVMNPGDDKGMYSPVRRSSKE